MSNNEETFGFSDAIQKKIVAMLLFDNAAFIENSEVVRPEYFENPALSDIVSIIAKFYEKYTRGPTADEFLEELSTFFATNKKVPTEEYLTVAEEVLRVGEKGDFEYVKDKVVDFARCQAVKAAISGSVPLWKQKKYDEILTNVRNALAIGEAHEDIGSFYYEELEERLEDRKLGADRNDLAIPTGLNTLDRRLKGGIAPGELGVIMGPMKRGKTIVGVNFLKGALLNGYSAVHYMFEGGEEKRLQRLYDSSISGVPKDELKDREKEVRTAVDEFFAGPKIGRLVVKRYPAGTCTATTVEGHLQKLRVMKNFSPSILLFDYLGLMRSAEKNLVIDTSSGKYFIMGLVMQELLSLSQRYGYAIWILNQSSRGSLRKKLVEMDDAADSILPMQDADMILTLNQTKDEGEVEGPQKVRILAAGGREIPDRWTENFMIDKECCRLYESDEEAK